MSIYKTDKPSLIPNCLIRLIRYVHVEVDGAMFNEGDEFTSSTFEAFFAWTAILCSFDRNDFGSELKFSID